MSEDKKVYLDEIEDTLATLKRAVLNHGEDADTTETLLIEDPRRLLEKEVDSLILMIRRELKEERYDLCQAYVDEASGYLRGLAQGPYDPKLGEAICVFRDKLTIIKVNLCLLDENA